LFKVLIVDEYRYTVVNPEETNTLLPIDVTEAGMLIDDKLLDDKNALLPIEVRFELGSNDIDVNPVS